MYEYTHLIVEAKSRYSQNLKPYISTHDVIDTIEAFQQISFNYFTIPPIKIKTKPVLFILKRRESYQDFMDNIKALDFNVENFESMSEMDDDLVEFYNQENTITVLSTTELPDVVNKTVYAAKTTTEEVATNQYKKDVDSVKIHPKSSIVKGSDKSSEKLRQIEHITKQKVDVSEKNQGGTIKKNIRKLISKYRRLKLDDSGFSESRSTTERVSVKKLIQQEKTNVEKEELLKIEKQVIEMIDSNPNIINKQLIKEKIHSSVMKELTTAIESKNKEKPVGSKVVQGAQNKFSDTRIKFNLDDTKSHKIAEVGVSKTNLKLPKKKEKSFEENKFNTSQPVKLMRAKPEQKIKIEEKPAATETSQKNILDHEDNLFSKDKKTDNAVDIYEEIRKQTSEELEDTNFEEDVLDEAQEYPDLDEKLEYANAQIENIMNIIAEIVDTIEVTDDVSEEGR